VTQLDDLHSQLLELDGQEEEIRRQRAVMMRVRPGGGGVTEAAGLLEVESHRRRVISRAPRRARRLGSASTPPS
jgi:hypothetical protein